MNKGSETLVLRAKYPEVFVLYLMSVLSVQLRQN